MRRFTHCADVLAESKYGPGNDLRPSGRHLVRAHGRLCHVAPPRPEPTPLALPARAAPPVCGVSIQRAIGAPLPARPTVDPSFIGQEALEQARAILSEARTELEPRQWELLDGKLTEAERAFERFNRVANASGKVAQVAR